MCNGGRRIAGSRYLSDLAFPAERRPESRFGGQNPERLAARQRSNGAEVPLVERGDVDRAKSLGERNEGGVGESETGFGVALGDLHR